MEPLVCTTNLSFFFFSGNVRICMLQLIAVKKREKIWQIVAITTASSLPHDGRGKNESYGFIIGNNGCCYYYTTATEKAAWLGCAGGQAVSETWRYFQLACSSGCRFFSITGRRKKWKEKNFWKVSSLWDSGQTVENNWSDLNLCPR